MNLKKLSHKIFIGMILIKGMDGIIQLGIGLIALFMTHDALNHVIGPYLQKELIEDQHAIVAKFLWDSLQGLTISTQYFIALYFISHGIIKFFIVYNVLKQRHWAYPFALIVFSFFTLYQIYLYTHGPSLWMIGLIIFDIIAVLLTYIEYKNIKKKGRN